MKSQPPDDQVVYDNRAIGLRIGYYYTTRSVFTGDDLLVVLTPAKKSINGKTGRRKLSQQTILPLARGAIDAVRSGQDDAVCGDCARRWSKGGNCYVNVGRAPQNIWQAIVTGSPSYRPLNFDSRDCRQDLAGYPLRLGSYGDPVALPFGEWMRFYLSMKNPAAIGYTHAWNLELAQIWRPYLMASCDSPAERAVAKRHGWRTFRVRKKGDPLLRGEIECPASAEQGFRLNCSQCMICYGAAKETAVDVSIIEHGGKVEGGGFF